MNSTRYVFGFWVLASCAQADTISHWSMNGSGIAEVADVVADVVGDNDGFVINDPLEYVAGPTDSPSALLFEQSSQDKIDVPDSPSLHFDLGTDSFTLESVFRVADGATGRPSPFSKNGSAAADSQYWARVRADQTGGVQFLFVSYLVVGVVRLKPKAPSDAALSGTSAASNGEEA